MSCPIVPFLAPTRLFGLGLALTTALPAQGAFLVDSVTDELYSVDHTDGSLVLIGSTLNNGLTSPVDLTWRRETQELWTIDFSGGEIGTLDPETATFTPVYDSGMSGWQGIAWHEWDQCFYLSHGDDFIYRYVPATATLTALGNSGMPLIATLDTDGDELYGIDLTTGSIVAINRSNGSTVASGPTAPNTTALAISPGAGEWFAIDASAMTIARIDRLTGVTSMTSALAPGLTLPRGLEFAERRLGITMVEDGSIWRVDETTGCKHRFADISGINSIGGVSYVRRTGELWAISHATGVAGTIDQRTGTFTPRVATSVTSFPVTDWTSMAWDETTGTFFLVRSYQEVYAFDPDQAFDNVTPLGTYSGLGGIGVDVYGTVYAVKTGIFGILQEVIDIGRGAAAPSTVASVPSTLLGGDLAIDRRTHDIFVTAAGQLHRVDRSTGTTTPIGDHGMIASGRIDFRDHAPIYVVDSLTDVLGSLDASTGTATELADTSNNGLTNPADLAYRAATNELWVVDSDGGEVGRIDHATGEFTHVFATGQNGFSGICWDAASHAFFLTNMDDNLYRLDPQFGATTLIGPMGYANVRSIDVDAAGDLIAIDYASGATLRLDRATGAATVLGTTTIQLQGLAIDHVSGEWLAVRSSDDSFYLVDPATSASTLVGTFGAAFPLVQGIEVCEDYGSAAARATTFGAGCGGMTATTQTEPRVGQRWVVQMSTPQQATFGAIVIGLQQQQFGLDPLGAPGCTVHVNGTAVFLPPPLPAYAFDTPNASTFVGLSIFVQGLALVPGANPLGVVTSNGVVGRIGW